MEQYKIMDSLRGSLLIYSMLDELAYEKGYKNGIQDLICEEPCVNIELLQIVKERLEKRLEMERFLNESNKMYI